MKIFPIKKLSKEAYLITYKLLYDLFFLLLMVFTVSLIVEGLVPGLFSSYLSLMRIFMAMAANATVIYLLGNHLELAMKEVAPKKNLLTPVIIIFTFLLIGNSMLHFALWQNLVITLATLVVFYLFYKILFSSEE